MMLRAILSRVCKPEGRPFATVSLADCFPGWKIELYFKGGDIFDKAADRQIAIYVWTGSLVILLILVVGAFARSRYRQANPAQ